MYTDYDVMGAIGENQLADIDEFDLNIHPVRQDDACARPVVSPRVCITAIIFAIVCGFIIGIITIVYINDCSPNLPGMSPPVVLCQTVELYYGVGCYTAHSSAPRDRFYDAVSSWAVHYNAQQNGFTADTKKDTFGVILTIYANNATPAACV